MTPINFGSADVSLGSAVLTTGTITANCTGAKKNATARTCLSIDRGSAGDATSRKLLSGAISLRLDLYSDAAMMQLWGSYVTGWDGQGIQVDFATNSSGDGGFTHTVYAQVFGSQQSASPGAFASIFAASPHMY